MSGNDDIDALQEQIWQTSDPRVQVRLLEEAIREADARQDELRSADLREELVRTAISAGLPDRSLVAIAWLRNHARKDDPDAALGSDLLWQLKWVAEELPYFLGVTRAQLDDFFADMHREYDRAGASPRPVIQHQMMAAMVLGRPPQEVEALYVDWQSGLRDGGADCAACERHWMAQYKLYVDGLDVGYETAAPLLEDRLSCWQVPQRTVGLFLLPLYDAGRIDRAKSLQAGIQGRCRGRADVIESLGTQLELSAVVGDLDAARANLEAHLRIALENPAGVRRLPFLFGAHALATRWVAEGRPVRLQLPLAELLDADTTFVSQNLRGMLATASTPPESPQQADFDPVVLRGGFRRELEAHVEQSDRRGETDRFAADLARHLARLG